MADSFENIPILYAYDAKGVLRHVDDVENGLACGCFCPDPHCGKTLNARNKGIKRIHHFAHRSGTCAWSVENVITKQTADVLQSIKRLSFPVLSYYDQEKHKEIEVTSAREWQISAVKLCQSSGRGAPDIVVTCPSRAGDKRYGVMLPFIHAVDEKELKALASKVDGVVVVDLRTDCWKRKRETGKHFDREEMLAQYQMPDFLQAVLMDQDSEIKSWAFNKRRYQLECESRERWEAELAERKRKAQEEEAERERKNAELAARLVQRRKEEKRRAEEEAREEASQLAQEEALRAAEWEEAERHAHEDALKLVERQDVQARDRLGRRWVKCERCGEVKLEEEFSSYGGVGRVNLGTCTQCMRGLVD